jgi:hypothetical protein
MLRGADRDEMEAKGKKKLENKAKKDEAKCELNVEREWDNEE